MMQDHDSFVMSCLSDGGFTEEEATCMYHVVEAWVSFHSLPIQHSTDRTEFVQAIHTLQQILGMRVLRRDYPGFWISDADVGDPPIGIDK